MEQYTETELLKNIEELEKRMHLMKLQRTELSQNINSTKKQIEKWKDMSTSQFRMDMPS